MESVELEQITKLLSSGDAQSLDTAFALIYQQLRAMAARQLAHASQKHTLQPTALVHELYLRLAQQGSNWTGQKHFFCVASACIRSILIDHARRRGAAKRGGGQERVTLDGPAGEASAGSPIDLLDLDEAMRKLAQIDERRARIAELRLFAGLTGDEIADALDLSRTSVEKEWRFARAWLSRALGEQDA